jgi:ubiquinone biosynthesis protein
MVNSEHRMSRRSKSSKSSSSGRHSAFAPGAIPREIWRLTAGWWAHASIGLSWKLTRAMIKDSSLIPWSDGKVYSIVGEALLSVIDAWGPLYGKAMQILLSRMSKDAAPHIERLGLDRVYGDWPAIDWLETQVILDLEIPQWRDELKIEARPLGVASMSQVHAAVDLHGNEWVVKFLKPASMVRLTESITAIESAVSVAEPFAMTRMSRRFIADVRELCDSLRREMNLEHERATMLRVHELIASKRQKSLRVPTLHPVLGSKSVIVMERLNGVKLSDIVSERVAIDMNRRKSIARKLLSELLVQIFEWGLFHADPHAGNLMLLDDGTVGLYDWGLAGELLDSDRKFIAGILKAVMATDIERLIDVLADMGRRANGQSLNREKIRTELHKLIQIVTNAQTNGREMPSLNLLVDAALEAADRLGIPMPAGLILMAKSLVTVEGLARGIDEDVPFARVAGPVLFRASDPGLGDVVALAKQIPGLLRNYLKKDS